VKRWWLLFLLPAGLGLAIILPLLRAGVVDFAISLPIDLDLILVVTGISISAFAAISLVLREGMERLRQRSVELARSAAFAEHRRFLQRLDHEFKNPLTAIRAGMANLAESLTTVEQRQILASMENQIVRLSRLVTGLRKLAELETLPLEISTIDVAELLEEAFLLLQERAEVRERQLVLSLPPASGQLPPIMGDRDLLLLAVHNLLDNALKFSLPNDAITLQAEAVEDAVVIQVVDTGQGIPEAETSLVWEELYRGQRVNGTFGSGIGLALVEAIVKRHAGQVSLTSEVGKGTTVQIRLPLTQP